MSLTKIERVKWVSELKHWLEGCQGFCRDDRGYVIPIPCTKKLLADKMKVYPMVVYRWFKTGKISPHFRRELIRLKIVRKEYV